MLRKVTFSAFPVHCVQHYQDQLEVARAKINFKAPLFTFPFTQQFRPSFATDCFRVFESVKFLLGQCSESESRSKLSSVSARHGRRTTEPPASTHAASDIMTPFMLRVQVVNVAQQSYTEKIIIVVQPKRPLAAGGCQWPQLTGLVMMMIMIFKPQPFSVVGWASLSPATFHSCLSV